MKRKVRFASLTSSKLNRIKILNISLNSHLIVDISAYRLAYINIKDIIVFATLKIKDIYDFYYKSIFFKIED